MLRNLKNIARFSQIKPNPFIGLQKTLKVGSKQYKYFSLPDLKDKRLETLPYSIRVLLECALRNCDEFNIKKGDVEKILAWEQTSKKDVEIPFKPARVLLQDFTGVPSVLDLAAMRDAMVRLGKKPEKINPACPVDLVIDHSVQADISRVANAFEQNEEIEFKRNYERFEFLKWGQKAFDNLLIVPPGSGIVHQVNLEYLARVVFENKQGVIYPDSLVGADSHTTMINGLGVTGWGVGGIEAEAVMLGECISMVLPEVVGVKLVGQPQSNITATDIVLTVTQLLRERKVVGKFVEFFGEGVKEINLADRATIANMAPEYGATMGFFPVDSKTIDYLKLSGRKADKIDMIEAYLQEQKLFRNYTQVEKDPTFSGPILEVDLGLIQPSVAGPKRPQDRVPLQKMKKDFETCLTAKQGFKGFGLSPQDSKKIKYFDYENKQYDLKHGSVVIAAITSCTNTSNPDSMIMAGLLAKNAYEKGLNVQPYIKTVLAPGSQVVTQYFDQSGLTVFLEKLGFVTTGYGCMVCIGNTGNLDPIVEKAITEGNIVASAVLSGNRNFEARIHPNVQANYLASPPLVVAYALAGTVDINFETDPIQTNSKGEKIFLKDIWPTRQQAQKYTSTFVNAKQFQDVYSKISQGTERWNNLKVTEDKQYNWKDSSTYIHNPPFFKSTQVSLPEIKDITNAYCLLNLGDSVTTDHISPAGNIAKTSAAAQHLKKKGVEQIDFNTYGSRRGNDEIMARGTFANTKLTNKMMNGKVGPQTVHIPTGEVMDVFSASQAYIQSNNQLIVLAGKEYGTGSSRDWAAKGPYLLGIKAVIAESFERIHRSNLVGMGILPLQFVDNQNADKLSLNGKEQFTIMLNKGNLTPGQKVQVKVSNGKTFETKCRLDTDVEIEYFKNGGILQYVLRRLVKGE